MAIDYVNTPIGLLEISACTEGVSNLCFVETPQKKIVTSAFTETCKQQISEFFKKEREVFDVKISFNGTDFQKKVWNELFQIPYGVTISYSELSQRIGRKDAVRAVARAVGSNPITIIVPCHRVIGKDGKLTGYHWGIWRKQMLIDLESGISKIF